MIFSRFIKKDKWQSKDVTERLVAVNEELEKDNDEHRKILLQLTLTDDSEQVKKAALLKLNSFQEFVNIANGRDKKFAEFANKQLTKYFNGELALEASEQDKQAFIQNANTATLEAWLKVADDVPTLIALYKAINKPQLILSVFNQHNEQQAFQQYLLEQCDDISTLEKMLKKVKHNDIRHQLEQKVELLREQAERPAKIIKQTQLTLSMLLALKDSADYEVACQKKAALLSEYEKLSEQFDCLAEEEKQQFEQKFSDIVNQLEKALAPKAEAYEQDKIAKQLAQDKVNQKKHVRTTLTTISEQLVNAVFTNEDVSSHNYEQQLEQLADEIQQSVLSADEKSALLDEVATQKNKLEKLPAIANAVAEATQLISKISQVAVPESIEQLPEKQSLYQAWMADWKAVKKQTDGTLPQSIISSYQEIVKQWRTALQPLENQQQANFKQAQKRVFEVKRLIASGKYNIAFGVFKKAERLFASLSEHQQHRLQREYDAVAEKIADLSDWEHYIATPRKQQLLEEVKAIVEQPLDNPQQQANKVKSLRKTWISLGHADDDIDQQLNHDFNELIEQAFKPCRQYYAEQEHQRELHLKTRQQLLDQAKQLVALLEDKDADFKVLEGKLNKLKHQWQQAGDIDRSKYKQLQQQFIDALAPLKSAIVKYHDENVVLKQKLIKQAQLCVENEDVQSAVNQVKQLQSQWRAIGYAGAKKENSLWRTFRELNDQVFQKRTALKDAEKEKTNEATARIRSELETITSIVTNNSSKADLANATESLKNLENEVLTNKPVVKSALKVIQSALADIEKKQNDLAKTEKKQLWLNIFNLLSSLATDDVASIDELDTFIALPASWQKRIKEAMQGDVVDRQSETIAIEILAGVDSPEQCAQQRLNIQVSLMQTQMQAGGKVDLQQRFVDWLQLGRVSESDQALIERLKPIYC